MKLEILLLTTIFSNINAYFVLDEMELDINEQTFVLFTKPFPESLFSCQESPGYDTIANTTETCFYKKFHDNLKNLSKLWAPVARNEVQSWCSVTQGMWLFYSEPEFSAGSSFYGYIKTPRGSGNFRDSLYCNNLRAGQKIQSIRHMSHANISRPALSLFTTGLNVLNLELFMDGEALSLHRPWQFSAFGFSGFEPWTLYEDVGYKGNRTCLRVANDASQDGDRETALMSVRLGLVMKVGSVRRGCKDTEEFLAESLPSKGVFTSWHSETQSNGDNTKDLYVPLIQNQSASPSTLSSLSSFSAPGITLFDTLQNPTEAVQFHGSELVLPFTFWINKAIPIPDNISSSDSNDTATAPDDWELWTDLDFTGSHYCVRADAVETSFKTHVGVMSVKVGCSGSGNLSGSALITVPMLFLGIMQFVSIINFH